MKSVLIDTCAYSHLLHKHVLLQEIIENADKVYLSPIVIGELLAGFKKGSREKNNTDILENFIGKFATLCEVTYETPEIYSDVYTKLRKQGAPIPINDVWIAAQCIELGAKLLTFDKHFANIPGLRVWFGASPVCK